MFRLLIFIYLCHCTTAAAILDERDAVIVSYDYQNYGRGSYQFSYHTSNGIERNEVGNLVNEGEDNEHIVVKGYYAYTDPEGIYRLLKYTADENGYRVNLEPPFPVVEPIKGESPLVNRIQSSAPLVASILGK